MPKKQLEGLDLYQAKKAAEIFDGIKFPADVSDNTPTFRASVEERAKKFLDWRGHEKEKLPSIRSSHFPHYTAFAACMVVSSRESLETWAARLVAGKAIRSPEEEKKRQLEKAKKLFKALQELGGSIDLKALGIAIDGELAGEEDEDADETPAAHESAEDDSEDADDTPGETGAAAPPPPPPPPPPPEPAVAIETPPADLAERNAAELAELAGVLGEPVPAKPAPPVVPIVEPTRGDELDSIEF